MLPPPLPDLSGSTPPAPKFHWLLFLSAIFVPTIITVLAAQAKMKDFAPLAAVAGGGLSGIIAGILLGRRLGRTDGMRVVLGLVFVGVFAVACVTMNCIGCLAGGYQFNVH